MAQPLSWPPNKPFTPPHEVEPAPPGWKQPPIKAPPSSSMISPRMHGLRTDKEFDEFIAENKSRTVLVQFGSTWCIKCHEFFPAFYKMSKQVKVAVAQVDFMKERAKGIKFSPTFSFFRNGKKIDEVVGKDPVKLEDHLWLHSDG